MRYMTSAALAVVVLLAALDMTWATPKAESASGTIKLTYDPRGASKARTPAWAGRQNRFSVGSESSMGIQIAGTTVKTSARVSGRNILLGFDRSGDGKISGAEWSPIPRTRTMLISGKADGKPYVIRLVDISANYNKKTVNCWGQALIRSSMKGAIGRVPVRILDDDMDGKFSQKAAGRGGDAILIGKSTAAVPLREMHRIGKELYRLKVAEDGSSIDYERMADTAVGQVRAIFPANTMKSLVLVGKDSAFDVRTDGAAGIPADTYKLVYGVVSRSAATLTFRPGKTTPDYEIQAGMINTLRIGKPIWLAFGAAYRGGTVRLSAGSVWLMGSGAEIYGPLNFTRGGNVRPPRVSMLNGTKLISSSNMEYG